MGAGQGEVGFAALGVVFGDGFEVEFGAGVGEAEDGLGELEDGGFVVVADVDGADEANLFHHGFCAVDEVVYVAEGAGLLAFAEDGDGFAFKGLEDEVGDDAAVVEGHAGAVGVEDADDADVYFVLAVVVHHEGFGHPFAFVVAGAGADGVDAAVVGLFLRVFFGVAVDFGGGGLEDAGVDPFGQAQHVDGAHD